MLKTSTVTIHPNSAIISSVVLTDNGQPYTRFNSMINTRKVKNVSKLSAQSVRKVKKAITYMAHLAPNKKVYNAKFNSKFNFKLSFITLTLSSRQTHTDQEIKGIVLHKFLDYIQKVHKVRHYVWKAERQRNGNLHFHLVIDKYIDYQIIRNKWNEYQDILGYMSRYYNDKEVSSAYPETMAEYYAVNSTDVHSVRKIKDLKRYLIKYMIKPNLHNQMKVNRNISPLKNNTQRYAQKQQQQKQQQQHTHTPTHTHSDTITDTYIDSDTIKLSDNTKKFLKNMASVGRLWGCSHSLSNISGARDFLYRDLESELELLKKDKTVYIKSEAYFCYLGFDYETLKRLRCTVIIDFLNSYLFEKFGFSSMSVV